MPPSAALVAKSLSAALSGAVDVTATVVVGPVFVAVIPVVAVLLEPYLSVVELLVLVVLSF